MNISTIGAASYDPTSAISSNDAAARARPSSIPPAAGGSASISKAGDFMSKLQDLLQQDPAKFKEVVGQMAKDMKDAAGKATGDDAKRLNALADGLSQAASTGDLSALQPKQGAPPGQAAGVHKGHHGHGHRHGGGSSAVQSALQGAIATLDQALGGASGATSSTASATSTTGA